MKKITILAGLFLFPAIAPAQTSTTPRWRIGVEGGVLAIPQGLVRAVNDYGSNNPAEQAPSSGSFSFYALRSIDSKWRLGLRLNYSMKSKLSNINYTDNIGTPIGEGGIFYGKPFASASVMGVRELGGKKVKASVGAYVGYQYVRFQVGTVTTGSLPQGVGSASYNGNGVVAGLQLQGRYELSSKFYLSGSVGIEGQNVFFSDKAFNFQYRIGGFPIMAGIGVNL